MLVILQGILFRSGKAFARLIRARHTQTDTGKVFRLVTLTYDQWRLLDPVSKKLKQESYLNLPLDPSFREAVFSVQLFVQQTGSSSSRAFAVPAEFSFSGASAGAAVQTQTQRLQYIREQHERFHKASASRKGAAVHPCVWSQGEFIYESGKW